jgi:hypothetical protein
MRCSSVIVELRAGYKSEDILNAEIAEDAETIPSKSSASSAFKVSSKPECATESVEDAQD